MVLGLKHRQQVFLVFLLDCFLPDIDVQVHIFLDQAVICCFLVTMLMIVFNILQDGFRSVLRALIMIIHHFLVADAVIVNQFFQGF